MIRKLLFVCAIVALALAQVLPMGARAAVPNPSEFKPPPITERTLANGLKVVVAESHAVPVVQVAMWYRFGASEETPGKTGLAHALEHMMFRGTPSLSDAGLDDVIARVGAQVNADTTLDATHFYAVVPRDRLALWMRIESDRMQHLTLSDDLWKIEKGAVLQEYDADYSDPISKMIFAVNRAAYGSDPLGRGALGVRADIVRSTAADLRGYYGKWYAPNNAVLVVTGDVKPSDVFDLAQRTFGSVARKTLPARFTKTPVVKSGTTVESTADVPFRTVDFAYAIPGQTDRKVIAPILISLASENARSPIRSALVNTQIAMQYSAEPVLTMRGSMFHLIITLAPGKTVRDARRAWEEAFKQTFIDSYPSELIDAAKRAAIVQDVYDRDSLTGLGSLVGNSYGVEGGAYPNRDNDDIAHESQRSVQDTARRVFAHPTVIGVVNPQNAKPGDPSPASAKAGAINDSFSSRVPSGKIVEAPWVRDALAITSTLTSHVSPVAYTLPNGLRLLVQEAHDNPTVSIAGLVESSPRADPPGQEGITGVLSSMMSYGSEKYTFEKQRTIADDLAAEVRYGGSFGAHGLSRDFPQLLDLLADDLKSPALPPQYFPLIRDAIKSNVTRSAFDPAYRAARAFAQAIYPPGDPALREPTAQSLDSIGVGDLRLYSQRLLRPETTVMVVVGDVKASEVRDRVEAALGSWKATGAKLDLALPPIPAGKGSAIDVPTQSNDVAVRMGLPAIARSSPDFDGFSVLNQIFGGDSFDSRLFKEVRMRRGLVYTIYSDLEAGRDRGLFEIGFRSSPQKVGTAVSVVKSEMKRMQDEPVAQAELDRARTRIVGTTTIAEQDKSTLVGDLLDIGENGLPLDYYATLSQRFAAIDSAAIQRIAKTYLHPEQLIEVYQGPHAR